MKITKDIIADLYPLYAEQECSADTRALVDEYLKAHPQEADELRRVSQGRSRKLRSCRRYRWPEAETPAQAKTESEPGQGKGHQGHKHLH